MLTSRQHRLKDFLKDNFVSGKYFSIEELVAGVMYCDGEPCYKLNTDPKSHDKCIDLSNDIRTINWELDDGWKIIIKNSKGGAKLAENKQEFMTWWQKEHDRIETKYQYLNTLKSKADKDGTIPLYNQRLNENVDNNVVESYQQEETIEVGYLSLAFINLLSKKIFIVKGVEKYTKNLKTYVVNVIAGERKFIIQDIHSIKLLNELNNFYSNFEQIVLQ